MSVSNCMFTSNTDEWSTPQYLFDALNTEFNFDVDVCASCENAKCKKYFTKEQNSLLLEWQGTCFMNPPYGRTIGKWVKKAYEQAKKNKLIVCCLLPARTDTKWWHEYCMQAKEIRFIKGRLKFGQALNSAPFPSVIVIFDGNKIGAETIIKGCFYEHK